jgi:hypothetical protein
MPTVHVGRHEHDTAGNIGAAPGDGGRNDPDTTRGELGLAAAGELEWHLVVKAGVAGLHPPALRNAEIEQHRLLQPFVNNPAGRGLFSDACRAAVEHADRRFHGLAQLRLRARQVEFRAALESRRDDRL